MTPPLIVTGIDVGGCRKGFHVVALRDGLYWGCFTSTRATDVADWCRQLGAQVIGVDAPCRWSPSGRSRPAERELMQRGISCFSTPTRKVGANARNKFYEWMRNGMTLYRTLRPTHPVLGRPRKPGHRHVCFETFPQAIACSLAGKPVSAGQKRTIRAALLRRAGVDTSQLTSQDLVDAALCALAAHYFACSNCTTYGDADSGYIVIPTDALS